MLARIVAAAAAFALGVAAFCGAAPTEAGRIPFGLLFVAIAGFIWFKWRRVKYGFDRPVMDDIAGSYWGGGAGPKVPEGDRSGPPRDRGEGSR